MQTLAKVQCTSAISVSAPRHHPRTVRVRGAAEAPKSSGITRVNNALFRRQVPIASHPQANCAQSECTGTERFSPRRMRCGPRPGNNFATSHHRGSSGLPHLAAKAREGTELRRGSAIEGRPAIGELIPPRRNSSTSGGILAERTAARSNRIPVTSDYGGESQTRMETLNGYDSERRRTGSRSKHQGDSAMGGQRFGATSAAH